MSAEVPAQPSRPIKAHRGAVNAVRFNASGQYCVTAGADKGVKLWNPHKPLLIKEYSGHGYEVADVAVSTDNRQLASCGGDKMIFLWDVATAKTVRRFGGTRSGAHTARINCVRYGGHEDAVLVSGSYDTSVRIWDVRSRNAEPVQVLQGIKDSVSSVQVRGELLLSGSIDGRVRVHDVRTGTIAVDDVGEPVGDARFSNDGNCVLASSLDSTVRLMDRSTGEVLASYRGHVNSSFKAECALTYDDSSVVCGSEDGRVAFWDLVDAERGPIVAPKVHEAAACSISPHPSEPACLSGSHDGSIVLWTRRAAVR